jgi:hypothetical protein
VPVIESLSTTSSGTTGPTAAYGVSGTGVLACQAALWTQSQPVLVDRGGREIARQTASGLETSRPRALFSLNGRPPIRLDAYSYDVLPDGRFLVNRLLAEPGTSMIRSS